MRAGVVALLLLTFGCVDLNAPEGLSVLSAWEGALSPTIPDGSGEPPPPISGNVAAVVREPGTEVGIGVEPFDEPDLVMDWRLHAGSCDVPGEPLGPSEAYARLSESELDANAHIAERLSSGNAYHVAVTDAGNGDRLACGDLTEVEE